MYFLVYAFSCVNFRTLSLTDPEITASNPITVNQDETNKTHERLFYWMLKIFDLSEMDLEQKGLVEFCHQLSPSLFRVETPPSSPQSSPSSQRRPSSPNKWFSKGRIEFRETKDNSSQVQEHISITKKILLYEIVIAFISNNFNASKNIEDPEEDLALFCRQLKAQILERLRCKTESDKVQDKDTIQANSDDSFIGKHLTLI